MKHDIAKYVEEHSKKFLLVNSISKRVRDLQSGHKSLVPSGAKNIEEIAIEEFRQNKVNVTTMDDEESAARKYVPLDMNS